MTGLSCRDGNASFPLKELCFRLKGAGRFFLIKNKKEARFEQEQKSSGGEGSGVCSWGQ